MSDPLPPAPAPAPPPAPQRPQGSRSLTLHTTEAHNLSEVTAALLELDVMALAFERVLWHLGGTAGDERDSTGADSLAREVAGLRGELAAIRHWLDTARQPFGGDRARPTDQQRADRMAAVYDFPLADPSDHPRPRGVE